LSPALKNKKPHPLQDEEKIKSAGEKKEEKEGGAILAR
jgi:hypothetical protein